MITEGVFCAIMREGERNKLELLMPVRADGKGLNLVGGKVEVGETREQAAVREALEETGLEVRVFGQIGCDLPMWQENRITDIASIYAVEVTSGELRQTEESVCFQWVSKDNLPSVNVVRRPCPGFPMGRTYTMAEMALSQEEPYISLALRRYNMGTHKELLCAHISRVSEVKHVCWGSVQCSEQTCYGGDNALIVSCGICGEVLEDWDYVPGKGAVRRLR